MNRLRIPITAGAIPALEALGYAMGGISSVDLLGEWEYAWLESLAQGSLVLCNVPSASRGGRETVPNLRPMRFYACLWDTKIKRTGRASADYIVRVSDPGGKDKASEVSINASLVYPYRKELLDAVRAYGTMAEYLRRFVRADQRGAEALYKGDRESQPSNEKRGRIDFTENKRYDLFLPAEFHDKAQQSDD